MHTLTLRFEDRALEREFVHESGRGAVRAFRVIWCVGTLITAASVLIDYAVLDPRVLRTVETIRFGFAVPLLLAVAVFGFVAEATFVRFWQLALGVAVGGLYVSMIAIALVLVDAGVTAEQAKQATTAGVFLITTVYTVSLLAFRWATIANWTMTVALLILGTQFPIPSAAFVYAAAWLVLANLGGMTGGYLLERYRRLEFLGRRALEAERQKSEALLLNVLPAPIAMRLKADASYIAERFESVTILFADIVGFTELSQRLPAEAVVELLNRIFTVFDELAERHRLEKIKTIGDAYMVVGGLPETRPDHAEAVAEMALAMRSAIDKLALEGCAGLQVRIGMHTGCAVAGVIGKKKFSYDLWGDAVNTASRMESHGLPGEIQVSEATRDRVCSTFNLAERGTITVKGKGEMKTWWLKGGK